LFEKRAKMLKRKRDTVNKRIYSWRNFLEVFVQLGNQIQRYLGCEFNFGTTCKQLKFVCSAGHPRLSYMCTGGFTLNRFKVLSAIASIHWCNVVKSYFQMEDKNCELSSQFTKMFFVYGVDRPIEIIIKLHLIHYEEHHKKIKLTTYTPENPNVKSLQLVQEVGFWDECRSTATFDFDMRSVGKNYIKAFFAPCLYNGISDCLHLIAYRMIYDQHGNQHGDVENLDISGIVRARQNQLYDELLNGSPDQFVVPCTTLKTWEKAIFQGQ
jgi:hypothetical protein